MVVAERPTGSGERVESPGVEREVRGHDLAAAVDVPHGLTDGRELLPECGDRVLDSVGRPVEGAGEDVVVQAVRVGGECCADGLGVGVLGGLLAFSLE